MPQQEAVTERLRSCSMSFWQRCMDAVDAVDAVDAWQSPVSPLFHLCFTFEEDHAKGRNPRNYRN